MKLKKLAAYSLLALPIALSACAPPVTATKSGISVAVNPVGPTDWGYSVKTTGTANITKIVFTLTVSGCWVKSMPVGWRSGAVPGGIQVESATGALTTAITLACEANDGPIYVDAHILGGAATTVGPVSGPT